MTVRNIVRIAPALLALLASASTAGAVALAASPAPTPSTALVRVFWLREGDPSPWQATLNGKPWGPKLDDEKLTDFQTVPVGSPVFNFQPVAGGSDSATLQPGITNVPGQTIKMPPLQAGASYTILGTNAPQPANAKMGGGNNMAASGNNPMGGSQKMASTMSGSTWLQLIPDDATPIPGKAQVRIVQSDAMMTPPINTGLVKGDQAIFAKNLLFGGVTGFVAVDPGTYTGDKAIICRDATNGKPMHQPLSFTLAPGSAQTIYEHGGMGNEPTTMKEVSVPELAAATVPGSAPAPNTGEGGLAMWPLELALASLALALVTAAAWVAWPRRRA